MYVCILLDHVYLHTRQFKIFYKNNTFKNKAVPFEADAVVPWTSNLKTNKSRIIAFFLKGVWSQSALK